MFKVTGECVYVEGVMGEEKIRKEDGDWTGDMRPCNFHKAKIDFEMPGAGEGSVSLVGMREQLYEVGQKVLISIG